MEKPKKEKKEAVVEILGVNIVKEIKKLQGQIYEVKQLLKELKGESEMKVTIPENNKFKPEEEAKTTTMPDIPVPVEYRQIVNEVLNDKFGIKIEPLSDRPQFNLIIIVPEEYSSMSAEEKDMYKQDLRSKVLSYADGVNGVRGYVELVFNSFNPTIQAKIRI